MPSKHRSPEEVFAWMYRRTSFCFLKSTDRDKNWWFIHPGGFGYIKPTSHKHHKNEAKC